MQVCTATDEVGIMFACVKRLNKSSIAFRFHFLYAYVNCGRLIYNLLLEILNRSLRFEDLE